MARHRVFLLYVFSANQKREPSSKMPGSLVRDLLNEHRLTRELALNRILFCLPDTASACEITPATSAIPRATRDDVLPLNR
jgi:hypothetical protein